jgi:hypothetical protein
MIWETEQQSFAYWHAALNCHQQRRHTHNRDMQNHIRNHNYYQEYVIYSTLSVRYDLPVRMYLVSVLKRSLIDRLSTGKQLGK